jgi:hypothetical protein
METPVEAAASRTAADKQHSTNRRRENTVSGQANTVRASLVATEELEIQRRRDDGDRGSMDEQRG